MACEVGTYAVDKISGTLAEFCRDTMRLECFGTLIWTTGETVILRGALTNS